MKRLITRLSAVISSLLIICTFFMILASACSPKPVILQGILQEIDGGSRLLRLQTDDGTSESITLSAASTIQTNTRNIGIESLEPGLSVRIEATGETANSVTVNLAQVDAIVLQMNENQVTLEPLDSKQQLVLNLRPFSLVKREDDAGPNNSIEPGRPARAYYNPVSRSIYELREMPGSVVSARQPDLPCMEGVVWGLRADRLRINGEGGGQFTLIIDNSTKIMFDDKSPASPGDLERWDWVKVYYSPVTWTARQIEIKSRP